ncbi:MAG TPA: Uma2 family endonuclease [Thermomicrobiales bacterium]|nr:Uma2 family endonuclease [Thermomicrobiales bacterium]
MMTSPREYRKVVLELLPEQGHLSEKDYLWLTDHTNRLIEYTDGYIEVLPPPTDEHQSILGWLVAAFRAYLLPRSAVVLFAPLRLRLPDGKIREPDLLLLRDARDPRRQNRYWTGADLVLEVVSADKPERDLVEKRREYEQAGIPEYWIVNPLDRTLTVLALDERGRYVEHGVFTPGMTATSALLPDFSVEVARVFGAYVPPDEDDE